LSGSDSATPLAYFFAKVLITMSARFIIFLSFWVAFQISCTSTKELSSTTPVLPTTDRIAFYNVENLFDTLNNPLTADDDFTPTGRQKWTTARYQEKLRHIAEVIAGMEFPALVGMAEVESEQTLQDLAAEPQLAGYNYQAILEESPDYRGIDVALLYEASVFEPLYVNTLTINFPSEIIEDYTTRDILHVAGIYRGQDTLHLFVNHWPSRRDGVAESEPRRVYVAEQLRTAVDQLFAINREAKVIIMGDFNDEPTNKSIREILKATTQENTKAQNSLYNAFAERSQAMPGSYNYRGDWNMLDQIIVSKAVNIGNPTIYRKGEMIFDHPRYGAMPNRTYGGPNYYGGFSDHFPIYVDLLTSDQ